jgi:hypothetical protein
MVKMAVLAVAAVDQIIRHLMQAVQRLHQDKAIMVVLELLMLHSMLVAVVEVQAQSVVQEQTHRLQVTEVLERPHQFLDHQ